jgi:lipoprotein-releasing system permease protein
MLIAGSNNKIQGLVSALELTRDKVKDDEQREELFRVIKPILATNGLKIADPTDIPPILQMAYDELIGIMTTRPSHVRLKTIEFDANYVIGDIRHVQRINKWKSDQIGSFEVFVDDFTQIESKGQQIYQETSSTLDSQTIVEKFYYIFEWLKLFDFNILVILIVMIAVSTINMVVALLVLILERTQMIGILKSLGANNWSIRKMFLYNAAYLIGRGLLWGNVIGIGLLLLQKYFGIIKLNPESYYVNVAPVDINLFYILLLNIGTVIICLLVLLIPSFIITKITPSKSIRFE